MNSLPPVEKNGVVDDLRAVLAEGMRWLFEVEQPDTAILQHHGASLPVSGVDRILRFCPLGWQGFAVIIVDVHHVVYGGPYSPPKNPLAAGELEDVAALITQTGSPVVDTWNGHPAVTGSVALERPVHPTLAAAVERYRRGCPKHRTVFCGRENKCDWYVAGNRTVVYPRRPVSA